MKTNRRTSSFDAEQIKLIRDQRRKAELLETIPARVGTETIPSRLSIATIVAAVETLANSDVARKTAEEMPERKVRAWLADLCSFEFDATSDRNRSLSYHREELQTIDHRLEEHLDGGVQR